MAGRRAVTCFSPHSDDAALSCGGLLAMESNLTRVVTLFAGQAPPADQLTPFARELHQRWEDETDPMSRRRQEDACALAVLGCQGIWWGYQDAIYRHPAYDSEEHIFGPLAGEAPLEGELVSRCAEMVGTGRMDGELALFPLAVGHHVDHQLLAQVGRRLLGAGHRVAFYEDLPYAAWEGGATDALAGLGVSLRPKLIDITAVWERKIAAISCYPSQFSSLNRHGRALVEALADYASSLLPGGYAERLWWPEEAEWI